MGTIFELVPPKESREVPPKVSTERLKRGRKNYSKPKKNKVFDGSVNKPMSKSDKIIFYEALDFFISCQRKNASFQHRKLVKTLVIER